MEPSSDYTLIKLTGTDRPGLSIRSERCCAHKSGVQCVNAELWTQRKSSCRHAGHWYVSDVERKYAERKKEEGCGRVGVEERTMRGERIKMLKREVNWANSKFSCNSQILRLAQLTPCA